TRPFSFFDAHFGELCSLVPVEVLVHGVMLYLTPNLLGHQARARLRIPLWSPFGHHRGDRFLANESPSVNEQRSALSDQQPAGTMKNGFNRLSRSPSADPPRPPRWSTLSCAGGAAQGASPRVAVPTGTGCRLWLG